MPIRYPRPANSVMAEDSDSTPNGLVSYILLSSDLHKCNSPYLILEFIFNCSDQQTRKVQCERCRNGKRLQCTKCQQSLRPRPRKWISVGSTGNR
jgi:hypothetical protein